MFPFPGRTTKLNYAVIIPTVTAYSTTARFSVIEFVLFPDRQQNCTMQSLPCITVNLRVRTYLLAVPSIKQAIRYVKLRYYLPFHLSFLNEKNNVLI